MTENWTRTDDDLPRRGQDIWVYDSRLEVIMTMTVVCEPDRIDGDISHWMPRKSSIKPKPPSD